MLTIQNFRLLCVISSAEDRPQIRVPVARGALGLSLDSDIEQTLTLADSQHATGAQL